MDTKSTLTILSYHAVESAQNSSLKLFTTCIQMISKTKIFDQINVLKSGMKYYTMVGTRNFSARAPARHYTCVPTSGNKMDPPLNRFINQTHRRCGVQGKGVA